MRGDVNTMPLPEAYAALAASGLVTRLLELARDEDLGFTGDATTAACLATDLTGEGRVVMRDGGVVAGLAAMETLCDVFAPACRATVMVNDGERVPADTTLCVVRGPMRELLALERTMLNLLGRLSGIATLTARYVSAIPPGSRAALYDTRKTTPGLRVLEKYAVRCGGGRCHRLGLHDAVLIKDNHLAGVPVGSLGTFVAEASRRARAAGRIAFVEVEVDTLEQFEALLALPRGVVDIVLLDNMTPDRLRQAAARRDAACPWLELEASGGVTLASLPQIAATGVDRISVGALTHQAVSLDVGLDFEA
ncbi:MAG: nicotinate-nucleotide diphosphorylase (carboxylating) [Phycisphaerae bacterium]|nr:MAG: nicotinate-nucleotide diphosphorylase (carboxylating) [Phycisphaerae bacterium]